MKRVLLADQQPLVVAGIRYILQHQAEFDIVDEVKSKHTFVQQLQQHKPDVLIADYNCAEFITQREIEQVKSWSPVTQTLIISANTDNATIFEVIQSGVTGYLTKSCSREEVVTAIHSVAKGEKFFCSKILNLILEKNFQEETNTTGSLTTREKEILTLLAKGLSTVSISSELFLSPHTVHTHRKNIIKKLNIKSPTEFVIHAMDLGLLKLK